MTENFAGQQPEMTKRIKHFQQLFQDEIWILTCLTLFVQLGTIVCLEDSTPLAISMPLLELVGSNDLPFVDLMAFEWRLTELPKRNRIVS